MKKTRLCFFGVVALTAVACAPQQNGNDNGPSLGGLSSPQAKAVLPIGQLDLPAVSQPPLPEVPIPNSATDVVKDTLQSSGNNNSNNSNQPNAEPSSGPSTLAEVTQNAISFQVGEAGEPKDLVIGASANSFDWLNTTTQAVPRSVAPISFCRSVRNYWNLEDLYKSKNKQMVPSLYVYFDDPVRLTGFTILLNHYKPSAGLARYKIQAIRSSETKRPLEQAWDLRGGELELRTKVSGRIGEDAHSDSAQRLASYFTSPFALPRKEGTLDIPPGFILDLCTVDVRSSGGWVLGRYNCPNLIGEYVGSDKENRFFASAGAFACRVKSIFSYDEKGKELATDPVPSSSATPTPSESAKSEAEFEPSITPSPSPTSTAEPEKLSTDPSKVTLSHVTWTPANPGLGDWVTLKYTLTASVDMGMVISRVKGDWAILYGTAPVGSTYQKGTFKTHLKKGVPAVFTVVMDTKTGFGSTDNVITIYYGGKHLSKTIHVGPAVAQTPKPES